jgi:hypothetical protein
VDKRNADALCEEAWIRFTEVLSSDTLHNLKQHDIAMIRKVFEMAYSMGHVDAYEYAIKLTEERFR